MGQAAAKPTARPHEPYEEMEEHAHHELSHAVAHHWLELQSLVPWADTLPADDRRPYHVVRSYRWADLEDGDMVCDVVVHEHPDRTGHTVHRTCVIKRG